MCRKPTVGNISIHYFQKRVGAKQTNLRNNGPSIEISGYLSYISPVLTGSRKGISCLLAPPELRDCNGFLNYKLALTTTDCASDHELLAKFRLKLKKVGKNTTIQV